jgi:hypothetical protein
MNFCKKSVIIIFAFIIALSIISLIIMKEHKMQSKTITELMPLSLGYPNPYALNDVIQYRFVEQVGEFLVRRDSNQNIIGGLASSWTISDDRKSIVFHLRPDGLYNANEVVESLRKLHKANQTSHSNIVEQIKNADDITAIDSHNVKIITTGDAGSLLAPLIMADTVILPDNHWIKIEGFKELQVDWTKTRGPYVYDSGSLQNLKNEPIIYKPNPKHYIYSDEQLVWKIASRPRTIISNFSELKKYMEKEPSFTTIKHSETSAISWTNLDGISFYKTKPNSTVFLIPNINRDRFKTVESRVSFLKHLLRKKIPLLDGNSRAHQMLEPGFPGRMLDSEMDEVLLKIDSSPDVKVNDTTVWALPTEVTASRSWIQELAKSIELPHKFIEGPYQVYSDLWSKGQHDVLVAIVGLSDTDPISGATFLFAPTAGGLDFPDGRILNLLNSAKGTIDRKVIVETVHKAFRMAIEGGLMFPLSYVSNHYYYSNGVKLNIKDQYSESIKIWDIRLEN